jgi:hypothetical protein
MAMARRQVRIPGDKTKGCRLRLIQQIRLRKLKCRDITSRHFDFEITDHSLS